MTQGTKKVPRDRRQPRPAGKIDTGPLRDQKDHGIEEDTENHAQKPGVGGIEGDTQGHGRMSGVGRRLSL